MRRADDRDSRNSAPARLTTVRNPAGELPSSASGQGNSFAEDPHLELWPAALYLGLALVFFWKIAFTGQVLSGYDTFAYFYPYFQSAADAVRQFRLPLWNPDVFMGAPLLANLQMALFYPATLLYFLLPVATALSYDIILHVVLASFFTYTLARQMVGLGRAGALAAGICFGFSGFFAAQAGHINQLSAAVWLPLLLLLFDRAYRKRSITSLLLCGTVIGLTLLAGHTQETYMTLCALGGFFVWQSAGSTRRALDLHSPPGRSLVASAILTGRTLFSALRANVRGLALLGSAVLLGAGLAAVQLAPSLELAGLSIRSGGMGYRQVVSFSLSPLILPQSLLPGYWQNPFSEYVGYIGVTGLLLAVLGAVTNWRHPRNAFFLALAAIGLLLAFGGYTPLYIFGYALVPGFGLFRVPARWLYLYTFGAAMLAGLGLDWIQARASAFAMAAASRTPAPGSEHHEAATTGPFDTAARSAAAALRSPWIPLGLAAAILLGVHAGRLPAFVAWIVLTLSALWLLRLAASERHFGILTATAAILVVVTIELFAASRDLEYNHPTAPESVTSLRPALAHLLTDQAPYRILSLSRGLFDPGDLADIRQMLPPQAAADFATAVKNKEILAPNTPMLFGIQSMDGYDGGILPLKRYVELEQLFMEPWQVSVDGRLREQLTAIPDSRLLALMNVKYVIADKVNDVWVDNNYYDLGNTATLNPTSPVWRSEALAPFASSSIGLVSYLVDAAAIPDGTVIATLAVTDASGRTETYAVRAGRDTAEGEYALRSKSGPLLHKEARIVSSWQDNPAGHNYFAKITFPKTIIPQAIEVRYATTGGQLALRGLSLLDERVGVSQQLVTASRGSFRLVHNGDVKVYENLDLLPRAFVVHSAQVMQTNRAVLDTLADPAFRASESAVLIADGMDVSPLGTLAPGGPDDVAVERYEPERVTVRANLAAAGLLILTDMWYPGWRATVDGVEEPIYRVDHAFRGVRVPAGNHVVEYSYRPGIVVWGAMVSLASLAVLLLALKLVSRQKAGAAVGGRSRRLRRALRQGRGH